MPIRAALVIAGLIVTPALAFAQTRGAPNVLLIMTDDSGYGVPSTFGGVIPTPALDRIAGTACATFAEGARKAGFLVPAQTAAEVALQASPPQR